MTTTGNPFIDPPLLALDIIAHMLASSRAIEATRVHFTRKSRLWRAIRDHIADDSDCVLIERKGRIASFRGTGASVNFVEAQAHRQLGGNGSGVAEFFTLTVSVRYWLEPGDDENRDTTQEDYRIMVPIDLELAFSDRKFSAWLSKLRRIRNSDHEAKDMADLKRLVKSYPFAAKTLVTLTSNAERKRK